MYIVQITYITEVNFDVIWRQHHTFLLLEASTFGVMDWSESID